jgi:hypothetical protein
LDHLETTWIPELNQMVDVTNCIIAIVGNKLDLRVPETEASCVSHKAGEDFAKSHSAMFAESSAKTADQVEQVFDELTTRMIERDRGDKQHGPSVSLDRDNQSTDSSSFCC